jgi:signal transduction histidine kinase
MKLVLRVTVAIFLFLTISSAAIGYFAIAKYQSSQINLIDDSLNSKVKALKASKEDSLTVAQYLAQVSSIPVTVDYVTEANVSTIISVEGPNFPKVPSSSLIKKAEVKATNDGPDFRIRVFAMPENEKLILVASLTTVNREVSNLTKDLVDFIIIIDLLAGFVAFLVFRRDGKLNQVSHLMAAQQLAMQRFLGDASHELRTPLTVIKGYVGLAQKTKDRDRIANYLEKSSVEIMRMESLINDLLFLAEVGERQEDNHAVVHLGVIIRDHLEVLEALQPDRPILSAIDGTLTINGDSKLIDRMIANIFSNIRRHTPADAPVSVSLDQ